MKSPGLPRLQVRWNLFALILALSCAPLLAADLKPRVVVLTDVKRTHETDDSQSLVRLLAWADLVEIEGIVVSSGMNFWQPDHAIGGYAYGFELLRAYRHDVTNLMKLAGQQSFDPVESRQPIGYWPSPDYLVQRYALGTPLQGLDKVGAGKDNEGSRLITSIVDEVDDRPVYVLAWGGANVLAQTLWDLTENPDRRRSPEAVAAFVKKLRVVAIGDQDVLWGSRNNPNQANNSGHWLRTRFPGLHWVWISGGGFRPASRDRQPFYQAHIQGHGALGNAYPDHSNGIEGDTPSLFHVLPLGFGDMERPEWGTLAGLFVEGPSEPQHARVFRNRVPDRPEVEQISSAMGTAVTPAMWNLLAARMDWARSGTGNRPPLIIVDDDAGWRPLQRIVKSGDSIRIDASKTRDEESDKLTFRWEVLAVPGASFEGVALSDPTARFVELRVPAAAAGKTIHLLLTVTDDGAGHHLTAWRRIQLEVSP